MRARLARPRRIVRGRLVAPVATAAAVALVAGVVVATGDMDPKQLAAEIEAWFGDWQGEGPHVPAPAFGDPVAPAGADADNPVGEIGVIVEPDLPRSFTYAVMRPWRPVR